MCPGFLLTCLKVIIITCLDLSRSGNGLNGEHEKGCFVQSDLHRSTVKEPLHVFH